MNVDGMKMPTAIATSRALLALAALVALGGCKFNYVPVYSSDRHFKVSTSGDGIEVQCRLMLGDDGVFHLKSAELDAQYFANAQARKAGGTHAMKVTSHSTYLEGSPVCEMRPTRASRFARNLAESPRTGTTNCVSTGGYGGGPVYTNCTNTLPPPPGALPPLQYEQVCTRPGLIGYDIVTSYQIVGRAP